MLILKLNKNPYKNMTMAVSKGTTVHQIKNSYGWCKNSSCLLCYITTNISVNEFTNCY